MTRYDAIIVGAGQAGPALAARLADAGRRVAVVERHLMGGTCVNTGCTPTKTLVASAHAAHMARRAGEFGVTVGGPIEVDMARVMVRKDAVVAASRQGLEAWMGSLDGVTVLRGHARFVAPLVLDVGGTQITAPEIFLNVGGRAVVPDYPGVGDIATLTNASILGLTDVPEHLIVVGGGYVGLEFAQMFARFGSAVTVVERGDRLLKREDADVSATITGILESEGVALRLKADCIAFARHAEGTAVHVSCSEGSPAVIGSHVLLAVGRRPNTDDLGLDAAGIAVDRKGYIVTDDQLRTSVPGVWALGDCNGRGAFTHTAYNDFEIVADNLLDGADRRTGDRVAAYALYTDPPLGRVGQTEADARRQGRRIRVGQRPMTRVSRAVEKGETQGLMKIIVDADDDTVLGGAILGSGGDEAIHSILDMIHAGVPWPTLRRAMHIHPTVAELIPTLLAELGEAG